MSGLVGFTFSPLADRGRQVRDLARMADLLVSAGLPAPEPHVDEGLAATSVPSRLSSFHLQPQREDGIFVWLDGEILSASSLWPGARNGAEALAAGYLATGSFDFLARSDGSFAAVLYDRPKRSLYLVSDRLGMRFLFWRAHRGRLAWSSEIKGLLGLEDFAPRWDRQAIAHFMEAGYHQEDETWFEDVQLLGPGTALHWSLADRQIRTHRYWTPDRIEQLAGKVNLREIEEELGRRLVAAVERCCEGNHRIGVLLSGGLDSRAILASMPARLGRCPVLTFGHQRCVDYRLARRVAAIRGNPHHLLEISSDNWLAGRFEAVWRTDGLISLLHAHAAGGLDMIRQTFDLSLSGLYLDCTLGGAYLTLVKDRPEWWALFNRGRRATRSGMRVLEPWIEQRSPGLDARLLELAMAVPPEFRIRSRLYRSVLLRRFPKHFRGIGWQRSGTPVWAPPALIDARLLVDKVHDRARRVAGLSPYDWRQYVDYPRWLCMEPARSAVAACLLAPDALYPQFVDRKTVLEDLAAHLGGEAVRHEAIGRAWTLEIWLRQIASGGALGR